MNSLFLFILLNFIYSIDSSEPSSDPIVVINTEMHNATIWKMAVEPQEKYFVTASDDKTIKVWDIQTGNLIKTIRPPIGKGNEGKILAVAISLDGEQIAAGGITGYEWDDSFSIYIFNLNSGEILHRIKDLESEVTYLLYSKNGKYLVAGLRKGGIRIFNTINYELIKLDKNYDDKIYGMDFNTQGNLITTSYDGFIRLYDNNFRLIRKNKAPHGKSPHRIKFSPEGKKVAIGYGDRYTPNIDIISINNLKRIDSPITNDLSNCDLNSVAFSIDGKYLYAGGRCRHKSNNMTFIRKWDFARKGTFKDIPVALDTIFDIYPLKDGRIIAVSSFPSITILNSLDKIIFYKQAEILKQNFKGDYQISDDGSIISFEERFKEKPSISIFNVEKREYMLEVEETLFLPITKKEGLNITNWDNEFSPKLNGVPLNISKQEFSRDLAISPDGSSFLLGTQWYLRLFDNQGKEVWKIPSPSIVWRVNISGNGKIGIAAFNDGTIRWFRLKDGKELLAFFLYEEKQKWVLWTPEGYYDASSNGEELIGLHFNQGKDKSAQFVSIKQFKEKLHRPDLISNIFKTYINLNNE